MPLQAEIAFAVQSILYNKVASPVYILPVALVDDKCGAPQLEVLLSTDMVPSSFQHAL